MKWILIVFSALGPASSFGYTAGSPSNPYRAYPPSCLSDPLPIAPGEGPYWTGSATLPLSSPGFETVSVAYWRVACPGGRSAFVGLISRSQASFLSYPAPEFPSFTIAQGSNRIDNVRVNVEPNTVRSAIYPGTLIAGAMTFVFENMPNTGTPQIDFNQAFEVDLNNGGTQPALIGQIPAYDRTQYPTNSGSMPITGYNSGAYYDSAHGGEGMVVEVLDTGNTYTLFATWYTFDQLGIPFWLVAQASFSPGTQQVTAQTFDATGGGFAGNFTPPLNRSTWGTITFSFPDCNTMSFSYDGATDPSLKGPAGSGARTWQRLGSMNALTCF